MNTVGFVCFGEVNTPIERLNMKHDEALAALREKVENVVPACSAVVMILPFSFQPHRPHRIMGTWRK